MYYVRRCVLQKIEINDNFLTSLNNLSLILLYNENRRV